MMDCPNHKEYPRCPYGFLRSKANWPTRELRNNEYRICLSTPCNWKLEKQMEKILSLLKPHNKPLCYYEKCKFNNIIKGAAAGTCQFKGEIAIVGDGKCREI